MFDWLKKKPEDYVSSVDQLVDERSRSIVAQNGLDIDAIYPLCTHLNLEVSEHDKHLLKYVADSDKEQVLPQYRLLLASASVLAYELSQRSSISFPKPSSPQVKQVPKRVLSNLKKFSWQARRAGLPQQYEIMGRIFEDNLRNLESTIASGKIEVDIDATYRRLYPN